MRKVLGFLLVGMVLVSGSAFGQGFGGASDEATHNVQIVVPSVLRLVVDNSTVLFDFGAQDGDAQSDAASWASYLAFLEGEPESKTFAPTSYNNGDKDHIGVRVLSNRSGWRLVIDSVGDFGALDGTLDDRLEVSASNGGKSDVVVQAGNNIFEDGNAGVTSLDLTYGLKLEQSDALFTENDEFTDIDKTIEVTYKVTNP